jgi:hypothetical protein
MSWAAGGPILSFGYEATNTSSFGVITGAQIGGSRVQGPNGCLQVVETKGNPQNIIDWSPLQMSGMEVMVGGYPGGPAGGMYFSTNNIYLYAGGGNGVVIDSGAGCTISSLSVSSINGAAPGGGSVPANLAVSSLAIADNFLCPGAYGMTIDVSGGVQIQTYRPPQYSDALQIRSISTINGYTNPNLQSVGLNGNPTINTILEACGGPGPSFVSPLCDILLGRVFLGGNAPVQQAVSSCSLSSDGAGRLIAQATNMSVSSMTISSINGAAPGSGGAFLSTLFNGNSTINCDGTQTLLSFNTTIGNTYQIQTQMSIQGRGGQEGTLNDDVVLDLAGELYLNQVQGSFISTANAAARDLQIGTCGMWKAGTNTQNLTISGTFSTQVNLNKVFLLDYGAI